MTGQVPTEISPDIQARIDSFQATPEEATAALEVLTAKHKAQQAATCNEAETARHMHDGMAKSPEFYERLKNGDTGATKAWHEAILKSSGLDQEGNQVGPSAPPPMFETILDGELPHFARQHLSDDLRKRGLSGEDVEGLMGNGPFGDRSFVSPLEHEKARMALEVRNSNPARVAAYLSGDVIEGQLALEIAQRLAAEVVYDPAELARLRSVRDAWRAGDRS